MLSPYKLRAGVLDSFQRANHLDRAERAEVVIVVAAMHHRIHVLVSRRKRLVASASRYGHVHLGVVEAGDAAIGIYGRVR